MLYAIEARIRGRSAEERRSVRQAESQPLVEALRNWMQAQLARASGKSVIAAEIPEYINRRGNSATKNSRTRCCPSPTHPFFRRPG
jgi:hypothetical protein